jgi:hypothetical protein
MQRINLFGCIFDFVYFGVDAFEFGETFGFHAESANVFGVGVQAVRFSADGALFGDFAGSYEVNEVVFAKVFEGDYDAVSKPAGAGGVGVADVDVAAVLKLDVVDGGGVDDG